MDTHRNKLRSTAASGVVSDAPDGSGGVLTLTSAARGGLTEPEQIEAIVIKTGPEGRTIRLRDLARVELGVRRSSWANLDGEDVAALAVYQLAQAQPSEVTAVLQAKLAELRQRLPEGIETFAEFDFSQDAKAEGRDYLVLDVDTLVEASTDRNRTTLARGAVLLRQLPGVRDVLALSEQPFDRDRDQACLVVGLGGPEGAGKGT